MDNLYEQSLFDIYLFVNFLLKGLNHLFGAMMAVT